MPSATWDENIENDQKDRVGNERHDASRPTATRNSWPKNTHTPMRDRKNEIKANDHLTGGYQAAYSSWVTSR